MAGRFVKNAGSTKNDVPDDAFVNRYKNRGIHQYFLQVPRSFLGIFFNPSVAESVLLRLAVFLRNVLRYVKNHVGNYTALTGFHHDALGYLLSSRDIMTELHTRAGVLGTTTASRELQELTDEIFLLTMTNLETL